MNKIELHLSDIELKNILKMKSDNVSVEKFIKQIINEKVSLVQLDYGFYYNLDKGILFNKLGQEVKLTKTEVSFLDYLIRVSLQGEEFYVDIDTIKTEIWKKEQATVFTIRNKIRAIRLKTYDEIIRNKSNHGYRVNLNNLGLKENILSEVE